jgi:predicted transcriptional regulator
VYIDDQLAARLERFVLRTRPRPSKTSVIEAALEAYLDAHEPPQSAD